MAFVNTGFTGAFSPLWVALEMEPPNPSLQTAVRERGRAAVMERHDKLEAMIGDAPFLVGAKPALTDGVLIGVARTSAGHQVRWERSTAVDALHQPVRHL